MEQIATRFADITPSDTAVIGPTIGLYVGGAGTLVVKGWDDADATFECPAGTYIPGSFKLVMSTGTDATLIVAHKA